MSEFTGRRLPVYLLLDCSGSMTGEPIEAVRQGVKALLSDLRGDPMALENAFLSVITFASTAQQVCPLTDLASFSEPTLNAGGVTAMGDALRLLETCLDNEVNKASATQKGDYKPLIFLMTDGQPTDSWEASAQSLKAKKPGNIIACAAGPGADSTKLKEITDTVVELKTLQPEQLRAFFKWVSSSIKTASHKIDQSPNQETTGVNLAPPPANSGINIVL